jgi:hypothetical protein
MATHKPSARDYAYSGAYDTTAFQKAYQHEFQRVPKFNEPSLPNLLFLLNKIGSDSRIIDLRWTAYMLATSFVESSHTIKETRHTVDKHHVTHSHTVKLWRNFTPIDEKGHGKGHDYYLPVKVKRLPTGDARITEYDGDQWTVSAGGGGPRPMHPLEVRGAKMGTHAHPRYQSDDGDEHFYFGRGYVQLTWWSNYANAGVVLHKGLELLYKPELVNDPDMAYQIFATGMVTGSIFANHHRCADFFHGDVTDYVRARLMVNPKAKLANKKEVADIAELFEKVLFASQLRQKVAAR